MSGTETMFDPRLGAPVHAELHPDAVWAWHRLLAAKTYANVSFFLIGGFAVSGMIAAWLFQRPGVEWGLSALVWCAMLAGCFWQRAIIASGVRDFSRIGRTSWRRTMLMLLLELAMVLVVAAVQVVVFATTGRIIFSAFFALVISVSCFSAACGAILDASKTMILLAHGGAK